MNDEALQRKQSFSMPDFVKKVVAERRGKAGGELRRYGIVRAFFCSDEEDSLGLTTQRAERNQKTMFASTGNVTKLMDSLTAGGEASHCSSVKVNSSWSAAEQT